MAKTPEERRRNSDQENAALIKQQQDAQAERDAQAQTKSGQIFNARQAASDASTAEERGVDLEIKKAHLRSANLRGQHRARGSGVGATTMSAADQAKAGAPPVIGGVPATTTTPPTSSSPGSTPTTPTPGPTAPIMGGNRIVGGKAVMKTPGLDSLKPISPESVAEYKAGMESGSRARNAQAIATSPGVAAARAKVQAEDQGRQAQQIAAKGTADPKTRADSLANMPGVTGVTIHGGAGINYVGGKSTGAATPAAQVAQVRAPQVSQPVPSMPTVPDFRSQANAAAIAATAAARPTPTPAFVPPQVAAITPTPAPAPQTPQPASPNPGADAMASMVAKATTPPVPSATQAGKTVGQIAQVPLRTMQTQATLAKDAFMSAANPAIATGTTAVAGATKRVGELAAKPLDTGLTPSLSAASTLTNAARAPLVKQGLADLGTGIRNFTSGVASGMTGEPNSRVAAPSPATLPAGPINPKPQPRQVTQTAFKPTPNKLLSSN